MHSAGKRHCSMSGSGEPRGQTDANSEAFGGERERVPQGCADARNKIIARSGKTGKAHLDPEAGTKRQAEERRGTLVRRKIVKRFYRKK